MKNYLNESLSAQERAEALVNEMTVEEAASQLRYDAPAVERLGIPAYNWWNEACTKRCCHHVSTGNRSCGYV